MKRYSFFVFCKGVTRANQINAFVLLGIIILMLSHRTLYAQSTIDLSKPVGFSERKRRRIRNRRRYLFNTYRNVIRHKWIGAQY